ncbi:mitochondrial transcription termination factor 5 [Calliopsis andreniformis]|uniref:mitochondrial transcription termination factor 5 n=1 Tax=Calliopsis andreniformis TaxID=337506 RepID=UPI003FCDEA26
MFKSFVLRIFVKKKFERLASFATSKENVHDLLTTHLGYTSKDINDIFRVKWKIISEIPEKKILMNCKILQKSCVDVQNSRYLLRSLQLHPVALKNRIFLLEEMGVKSISIFQLYRFLYAMTLTVRKFKELHNIPKNVDISSNIFNSVGSTIKIPAQLDVNETKMSMYYKTCMRYFKEYHLKLKYNSLYKYYSVSYQSFRLMAEIADILKTGLQMDMNSLSKYSFLLRLDADRVNNFISEFKHVQIDGKPMLDMVRRFPRLLTIDIDNAKEILLLCKRFNIPEKAIITTPNILKMNKEIFEKRYRSILNIPEISIWATYPRILYVLCVHNMVMNRIKHLRYKKLLSSANIHTLLSCNSFFRRFVQGNTSHAAYKSMFRYILKKELGDIDDKVTENATNHPHWKRVPLYRIAKTLAFLRQHYSVADICKNIHIVFYPSSAITIILEKVQKQYTPEKGYNFTSSQNLALYLYLLEKNNHFTGDAIWQMDNNEESEISCQDMEDLEDDKIFNEYTNT